MTSSARGRRRHWYRRITRNHVLYALGGLCVLLVVMFGVQAYKASSSLRLAANQAELLQNQIVGGDDEGAAVTLAALQESTERARTLTDGFLWDLGSKVPLLGRNVGAVQTVSEVIDDVSDQALPPVVALSNQINLNTFSPKDGKVNLAAISEIAPSIAEADQALVRARERLDGIDPGSLLTPLRGPVASIQFKMTNAQAAATNSNLAAQLLPSMLGGEGNRRYALLVQNNAEIRSTGGISGSIAILEAKNGKLSMGFQGSIQDIRPFTTPVLPMTDDEKTVFPYTLTTHLLDANTTPDFPRTAEIAQAMVEKALDVEVDGVISVDPVAMSFILAGTGPVQTSIPKVVLDQTNAVDLLLNTTYQLLADRTAQDDVFKAAARSIFDVVKDGRGDPRLVIEGLVKGVAENRVMIWSEHEDEQALIAPSGLSGVLSSDDGATPHVGVYLGDAASTKMEYYLDYSTAVLARRCLPGKIQEIATQTVLSSSAPSNADELPDGVAGDGYFTPKGTMKLIVRLYSPYGGGFTEVRLDGKPQTVYADTHLGRNVTKVVLTIKPGERHTITTSMISGKDQGDDGIFSTTPGVKSTRNDVVFKSAC